MSIMVKLHAEIIVFIANYFKFQAKTEDNNIAWQIKSHNITFISIEWHDMV